jgi:hypothetical protein
MADTAGMADDATLTDDRFSVRARERPSAPSIPTRAQHPLLIEFGGD